VRALESPPFAEERVLREVSAAESLPFEEELSALGVPTLESLRAATPLPDELPLLRVAVLPERWPPRLPLPRLLEVSLLRVASLSAAGGALSPACAAARPTIKRIVLVSESHCSVRMPCGRRRSVAEVPQRLRGSTSTRPLGSVMCNIAGSVIGKRVLPERFDSSRRAPRTLIAIPLRHAAATYRSSAWMSVQRGISSRKLAAPARMGT